MSEARTLSVPELEALLRSAREARASVSLRAVGSVRLLGDLLLTGLEVGKAIHLGGAKRRDHLPPKGTSVSFSVLLNENVISFQGEMLDPIVSGEGDTLFPPVVRLSWPDPKVVIHSRTDLRVATPELPPLRALLVFGGQTYEAHLLNLNETGIGLGLKQRVPLAINAQVEVITELPGGIHLQTIGGVRHVELDQDPFPTRLGVVMGEMSDTAREALRRFTQARRADHTERVRQYTL